MATAAIVKMPLVQIELTKHKSTRVLHAPLYEAEMLELKFKPYIDAGQASIEVKPAPETVGVGRMQRPAPEDMKFREVTIEDEIARLSNQHRRADDPDVFKELYGVKGFEGAFARALLGVKGWKAGDVKPTPAVVEAEDEDEADIYSVLSEEAEALLALKSLDNAKAVELVSHGFTTIADVANADVAKLKEVPGFSARSAKKAHEEANALLADAALDELGG